MREIKFRFWDLDKCKMIINNIYGITQNPLGLSMSDNLRPLISINGDYCLPNFGQKCVTMQYTGLKDKNGKEIYEGDILRHEKYNSTGVMEWDIKNGCWTKFYPIIFFEVIGNIYENPELL